jgi:hypothetical protein
MYTPQYTDSTIQFFVMAADMVGKNPEQTEAIA